MPIKPEHLDELLAGYEKPEDLVGENGLFKQLKKALLERALGAELTHHLGYEKGDPAGRGDGNHRNGSYPKTVLTEEGALDLDVPRDRNGSFEPQIIDYIMHCGMPVVTTRGKGFEEEIVKIITDATGLPASTSVRSAIRALAHLHIENVVVLSPYPRDLHQSALTFLQASGFRIAAEHTEDVVFKRLQDVTPAHIAAVAKRMLGDAKKTDGIYIPCNQWAAADAVPIIEAECGLPVVSGAHADHWEAFRVLGIHDPLSGNGRLMESLRQDANALTVPSA